MNVPTLLLAPALLTAMTVTYVVAGPSRHSPGQASAERAASAESATPPSGETTAPAVEPASTATPDVPDLLPAGLSGRLTYRTGHELVAVQFPDARELSREPDPGAKSGDVSADGLWRAETSCPTDTSCNLDISDADGTQHTRLPLAGFPGYTRWSRDGHELAFSTTPYGAPAARDIRVIDDPADPTPRVVASADGIGVYDYAWLPDARLLVSLGGGISDRPHLVAVELDGAQRRLADTPDVAYYMYPSPDGGDVAFTQNSDDGWRLFSYDVAAHVLRDLGNMGSDPAGSTPPQTVPPGAGKGPMYIAWSPDGSMLAFGGGFEPPYFMTIVDLASGAVHRTDFPDGYPGEIKWSPDGTMLAVSSYNIPRTHHESYVIDPKTGIARDVLSGCVIIWSPDSRFLAIHGEKEPGVAIADVTTLEHAQLTHRVGDTPLRWSDAE